MKSLALLLSYLVGFFALSVPTAPVTPEIDNIAAISKSLQTGDVNTLSTFLDGTVEIALGEEEDIYTKNEAIGVLRKFFGTNKPSAFSQGHNGASKGGDSQYHIGTLTTSGGTYRVYIYLKSVGGQSLIKELRFDK
jgi:Domain of unknown function (DUF4783)